MNSRRLHDFWKELCWLLAYDLAGPPRFSASVMHRLRRISLCQRHYPSHCLAKPILYDYREEAEAFARQFVPWSLASTNIGTMRHIQMPLA